MRDNPTFSSTNIAEDDSNALFDRGKSRAGYGHRGRPGGHGETISQLVDGGVPMPGFSTTSCAYKEPLDQGDINEFKMVRSETGPAVARLPLDTTSGSENVVFVISAYGLGAAVADGSVNPGELYVFKPATAEGKKSIISRAVGSKRVEMVHKDGEGTGTFGASSEGQER